MRLSKALAVVAAAAMITTVLSTPAQAARKGRSPRKAATPSSAHPSDLKYSELDFKVPDAKEYRHELQNGIPVYIAEDHALPLVNISITLRIGSFLEQTDDTLKPGVASFTGTMMRQGGAGDKNAEAFDEAVDFLGTNIGSSVRGTRAVANMNSTTMVLGESLDLLFEMMKSPAFEQERIDIRKDELLENMKQRNDDAQDITRREWDWLMRGEEHFTGSGLHRERRQSDHPGRPGIFSPEVLDPGQHDDRRLRRCEGRGDPQTSWQPGSKAGTSAPVDVPWPPPPPAFTPQPGVYHVEKDIPQGQGADRAPGVAAHRLDRPGYVRCPDHERYPGRRRLHRRGW